jgi:hypothetical protein
VLSTFSKIADRPFIVGFLLPTLIFVVAACLVFPFPWWLEDLVQGLQSSNPFANLTYVVLAVWILATILSIANYQVFQILEGYVWPMSALSGFLNFHRGRLRSYKSEIARLEQSGDTAGADAIKYIAYDRYPQEEEWVLPTALGNTIRAFETYPYSVYGADGVVIWSRLEAVIPPPVTASIENALAGVNFFVSLCVFGWIFAGLAIIELIYWALHPGPFAPGFWGMFGLFWVGLLASLVFYWDAVFAVGDWSAAVRSAFDCFLPALASQLGYALPDSEDARKEFWTTIARRFLYLEDPPAGSLKPVSQNLQRVQRRRLHRRRP